MFLLPKKGVHVYKKFEDSNYIHHTIITIIYLHYVLFVYITK